MSPSSERSSTINDIEQENKRQPSDATEQNDEANAELTNKERSDGKVELTEEANEDILGYAYPEWRKWMILVKMRFS